MSQKLKTHCQSAVTRTRRAFSLVELLAVLVILVAVAGVVLPTFGTAVSTAKEETTRASLQRIQVAILGSSEAPGYFTHTGEFPVRLTHLFSDVNDVGYDPVTKIGWNGPYLRNTGIVIQQPSGSSGLHLAANGQVKEEALHTSFSSYVSIGEAVALDGYLNPIIIQSHTNSSSETRIRLLSAGPNGVVDNSPENAFDGTTDDFVLVLKNEIP